MIEVLLEDAAVLVVDKPSGIATMPERDPAVPSVQKELETARGERLFVVHRLDKEVSGCLVFARTAAAHRALSMAFDERKVSKTYLALASGSVPKSLTVIEAPLRQFGSGRMGVDEKRGKPSRTELEVLGPIGDDTTAVLARPLTDRRHQLRVHFHHIGHALVGDPLYGDPARRRDGRLMLHALRLTGPHPDGGELRVVSRVPPELAGLAALIPA